MLSKTAFLNSGLMLQKKNSCCVTENSTVVNSRVRTTKAAGYDWLDVGVRWRQRRCKTCGSLFETFEGSPEELQRYFDNVENMERQRKMMEALRELGEQLPGLVKRIMRDQSDSK